MVAVVARRIQVAFDCANPTQLQAFWAEALNYQPIPAEPGADWAVLIDPDRVGPMVFFHRVPEAKAVKNRVHIDVLVAEGLPKEDTRPLVEAEVRRLCQYGANHVRTDEEAAEYFAVMQDPEGNEFCIG